MVLRLNLYVLFVTLSSGFVLRGQPTDKELAQQIAAGDAEVQALQAQVDAAEGTVAVAQPMKIVKPSKPAKPQTEAEKLDALSNGLKMINNLRSAFNNKKAPSPMAGAEKFANGAMSEELENKDSQVWSTIESMLGAVQQATKSMKGKQKSEQAQLMNSLEGELNKKATVLGNVTDDVSKKQKQQDEEYLLGLLILHQNNWSMEKQLNATQTFMHNSPVLHSLFEHHDPNKPLAPQLAVMMDAETKKAPTVEKKADQKQSLGKAAAVAAHAFIQLTEELA